MFWPSKDRPNLHPKHSPQAGFTLIEVLVASVILASGLIVVITALARTQEAFRISRNLVFASQIAGEKIAETELQWIEAGKLSLESDQGKIQHGPTSFVWSRQIDTYRAESLLDETRANQIDVKVQWNDGRTRKNELACSTLLVNEPELEIVTSPPVTPS